MTEEQVYLINSYKLIWMIDINISYNYCVVYICKLASTSLYLIIACTWISGKNSVNKAFKYMYNYY